MTETAIRLAKRVAEMIPCSRAQAERYIAGGWVSVDGEVVEDPARRVAAGQHVALHPDATLEEPAPVTILLHKSAGYNAGFGADGKPAAGLIAPDTLLAAEHGKQRFLRRHLNKLTIALPLETQASGLVVYTQDFRVARKLAEEGARVEQEFIVEVTGTIREGGLALLNHGLTFNGREIPPLKVSWQNEKHLRFALKGVQPGQIVHMCRMVDLKVTGMKRIRIGRLPMAGLPVGQWRYLQEYERF